MPAASLLYDAWQRRRRKTRYELLDVREFTPVSKTDSCVGVLFAHDL